MDNLFGVRRVALPRRSSHFLFRLHSDDSTFCAPSTPVHIKYKKMSVVCVSPVTRFARHIFFSVLRIQPVLIEHSYALAHTRIHRWQTRNAALSRIQAAHRLFITNSNARCSMLARTRALLQLRTQWKIFAFLSSSIVQPQVERDATKSALCTTNRSEYKRRQKWKNERRKKYSFFFTFVAHIFSYWSFHSKRIIINNRINYGSNGKQRIRMQRTFREFGVKFKSSLSIRRLFHFRCFFFFFLFSIQFNAWIGDSTSWLVALIGLLLFIIFDGGCVGTCSRRCHSFSGRMCSGFSIEAAKTHTSHWIARKFAAIDCDLPIRIFDWTFNIYASESNLSQTVIKIRIRKKSIQNLHI